MAGIYLHIPFCKQACTYCNFHFTTSLRYKDDVVQALVKEIELQHLFLEGEEVNTIYFGGGTPSLLTVDDLRLLMETIHKYFKIDAGGEVTLEANPDDITWNKLQAWKEAGINRLSIGVQSFLEEELRWMNRAHNKEQAINSLQLAVAQFDNISIDLIYGSPLLTDDLWKRNVDIACSYNIPHLSCYALTVEEKTPLHQLIRQNKKEAVDDDKAARQFLLLMQWLREEGYEHYEVSNFAKPHFRSKHNSSYWSGKKYVGLGPSAHSYNGIKRQWNVANNNQYILSINKSILPKEDELLTEVQKLNEYIMISLRTKEGLNLDIIKKNWGMEKAATIMKDLHPFLQYDLVQKNGTNYSLTDEGMLRADGIASDLFYTEAV